MALRWYRFGAALVDGVIVDDIDGILQYKSSILHLPLSYERHSRRGWTQTCHCYSFT